MNLFTKMKSLMMTNIEIYQTVKAIDQGLRKKVATEMPVRARRSTVSFSRLRTTPKCALAAEASATLN